MRNVLALVAILFVLAMSATAMAEDKTTSAADGQTTEKQTYVCPAGQSCNIRLRVVQPIQKPEVIVESTDEGDEVHPIVKWLIPTATGALLGGGIASWQYPDGPEGDNYAFGATGKGAAIGAAAGLAFSLVWELVD